MSAWAKEACTRSYFNGPQALKNTRARAAAAPHLSERGRRIFVSRGVTGELRRRMESKDKKVAKAAEQEAFGLSRKRQDALRARAAAAPHLGLRGQQLFLRCGEALRAQMESVDAAVVRAAEQKAGAEAATRQDALRARAAAAPHLGLRSQQLFLRCGEALRAQMESVDAAVVRAAEQKAEAGAAKDAQERAQKRVDARARAVAAQHLSGEGRKLFVRGGVSEELRSRMESRTKSVALKAEAEAAKHAQERDDALRARAVAAQHLSGEGRKLFVLLKTSEELRSRMESRTKAVARKAEAEAANDAQERAQKRAQNTSRGALHVPKSAWSVEEDETLRRHVGAVGAKQWAEVALQLPGRSEGKCRQRWLYHLAADVDKSKWQAEEDQLIMAEVRKHGTKWTTFVHLLPGRTDQSIKTRYNTILRREQRAAAKAEKAAKEPGGPLLAVGQRVEVNYAEEGGWCKGTITKVRPKLSLYDVEVDNYKREKKVDRCDVRVLKE